MFPSPVRQEKGEVMLQTLSTKKVQTLILAAVAAIVLAFGLGLSAQQAYANPPAEPGIDVGQTVTVKSGKATFKVTATSKTAVTIKTIKASGKKVTIPATLTINGKKYDVTGIGPKALKKGAKKCQTLVVKTKKLTKKSVKKSLTGSKVKTVKAPKAKKKAYKKIFTKKNCGKKVKVK